MHFLLAILLVLAALPVRAASEEDQRHFAEYIRPTMMTYCGKCHDPDKDVPFFEAEKVEDISKNRGIWYHVIDQLYNRAMPPTDKKQPSEEERLSLTVWIMEYLHKTACEEGEFAGRITARRLNRLEYDNTIRDLIGLDLGFSDTFPTDGGGGEGFNNNGETLFLPPILMERYMEAAQDILDLAIVSPGLERTFANKAFQPGVEGRTRILKQGDEASVLLNIYVAGDYRIGVEARPQNEKGGQLVLKVDGIAAHRFQVEPAEKKDLRTAVRLSRGLHALTLQVPGKGNAFEMAGLRIKEDWKIPSKEKQEIHDRLFLIDGPDKQPETLHKDKQAWAREILKNFARKAFRRPVKREELDRMMSLYERAGERGDPFSECVKLAMKSVLISPHFLFRIETDKRGEGYFAVNDHELATRLSYFLWASMPDRELMDLADKGILGDPKVLLGQMQRLLRDPKADEFVRDFTGQWLGTREVGRSVAFTGREISKTFTMEFAEDSRGEPVEFMKHLLRENRSILELIDSDYTFLTERLAKHYGMEGVKGKEFRKVALNNGQRGGVIGMSGVHMLTAFPNRTSPVLRGAWVLETMLGSHVPSPPPDVPSLDSVTKKEKKLTLRQALEKHRDNPSCAACHNMIDPIGFGMENYDILGRWRDKDKGQPIDSRGTMPTGESFDGPGELRKVLLTRKMEFAKHLSSKMLGYALGRSLEDRDQCTVEQLAERLAENDFKSHVLLEGIVLSTPFLNRQRMGKDE